MKERPILFSGKMVRAILEGRKTQTRRVIKPQPDADLNWLITRKKILTGVMASTVGGFKKNMPKYCPYGQPGDHLWVRETWCIAARFGYDAPDDGRPGIGDDYSVPEPVWYRATDRVDTEEYGWRPSIHMPRWASRLSLEITGVRVERMQEITGRDVLAEGVDNGKSNPAMGERWENMQRMTFQDLWDSINGKRGYGWDTNPWVWVVEFKRA